MSQLAFFDTVIGLCGIAWSERGIAAVQLPESDDEATRRRLLMRCPGGIETDPPANVRQAIDRIVRLLLGESIDFAGLALDMDGVPPFHQRVYEVARTIPAGGTLTYGDIALRMGDSGAARAVGQALGHNPFPIIVPCHRVLAAHGRLGGFSASGGRSTKRRLLTIEGALTVLPL